MMRTVLLAFVVACVMHTAEAATATASHILVPDESKANELKAEIEGGADFGEKAKEHSTCPSGKSGGSLGNFGQGQMVPEFDKVIFDPATKMGVVYGPVKTQFGFHLIQVFKRSGVKGEESA
eukprot:TRINITY_DN22906_c1_g2_i1.p2 TRINITY_DN22906_c1_g2~~TRINITY_DN22906_c1_g2_i1.p2  ORF type:complete len:142 (+),score=57.63 TRINITY_DN22906_c1_g2_i1:62-427(+)